MSLLLFWL